MGGWDRLLKFAERVAGRVSDEWYLRVRFRRRFGRWPNLRKPLTFNEHLLRYKLSSRTDSRLPVLADKIAVKNAVMAQIGEEHIIPTYWSGSKLPQRQERNWPKPYVLKAAHRSGAYVIVHENDQEDWDTIESRCEEWLAGTFGERGREWHYARIKPRLLVEPYIGEPDAAPDDIKIQCFNGRARVVNVMQDRLQNLKAYSFDVDWNLLPYEFAKKRGPVIPAPPTNFKEMIRLAEILADGFEYVSVDLYNVEGRIYFGEMTFTTADGMGIFDPPAGDVLLGSYWREGLEGANVPTRRRSFWRWGGSQLATP
ncbi:MAG: ATP-grasp fold amidoligase family protein [Sphingobium sp.]